MKKLICIPFFSLSLLVVSLGFGQENNKSLLWEISGNGLEKKSYLYGTMHVSDRVSYHLTDAFFKHLTEADIVATESDFRGWANMDEILNNHISNQMNDLWLGMGDGLGGFYSNFRLQPIKRHNIQPHFLGINYSTNNLLFRTSAQSQDYQEETYLDMFIYQVGKKLEKQIAGLEDARESFGRISNIDYENIEAPSEENVQKILRLLKNRSPEEAVTDFYREKDIELIYSFMELSIPEQLRNVLLYHRNEIMVRSIDSLAQAGSLFASMGAAHLAGQRGAIELLRNKGYTVTPVHDEYTDWGKEKKKELDVLYVQPEFKTYNTYDQMVSLPMLDILLHNGTNTSSPDLTNGGTINLKRTPLNDLVVEKNARFNHLSLDSLFFENIPGQILSKDFVTEKHLSYYDIKNTTRSGDSQRYRFYITPLELITISMIGPKDYTTRFGEEVFSNITIKSPPSTWETITPARGGFSVSMPGYHTIYGSKEDPAYAENIEIQAFDPTNNSYYFLSKQSPSDLLFEESIYELERIHKEFYNQYDANDYTVTEKTEKTLISKSTLHNKSIYLKTTIEGNFYYLTGCIDCTPQQQEQLFNSFSLTPYVEDTDYRPYHDENFMFSIDLPFRQNELVFLTNTPKESVKPLQKDQQFSSDSKAYTFYSANGHEVELFVYKYHPYQSEVSADSLFRRLNNQFINPDSNVYAEGSDENPINNPTNPMLLQLPNLMESEWENTPGTNYYGAVHAGPVKSDWEQKLDIINENKFFLSNHEQYYVEEGDYHVFRGYGGREGTQAQLLRMIVFKDGIRYTLETVVPGSYSNDNAFVERLFGSFKPANIPMPYSVFENKLELFVEHLQSTNDSIKTSALNSISYLNFDKTNLPQIRNILNLLEIDNENTQYLKILFEKIAAINDPEIFKFVEDVYMQDNINTTLKISLIKGLAKQKNLQAWNIIIELLDQYLPIPERSTEIAGLFREFEKNPEYSKTLIPVVFDYFLVDEYKYPILDFCQKLMQSDAFEPESFKPFKDMLLANANHELRRTRSWVSNRKSKKQKTLGYEAVEATLSLMTYLHLIHPFIEEARFADWWDNVAALQIPEILIEKINLDLDKGFTNNRFARQLLQKEETLFAATVLLSKKASGYELPETAEQDIARSGVVLMDNVDLENQTLEFDQERTASHNGQTVKFFFFKCKNKETPRGRQEETILMSMGFVLNVEGKIMPISFFSGLQKPITDQGKTDEYIFEVIDQSLNWNNRRASYQKSDFSASPFPGFNLF